MKRGRPNQPSRKTLQAIYNQLSQNPQSPEKIVNINRKTLYAGLAWLRKRGLVSKRKCGNLNAPNKTVYSIPERFMVNAASNVDLVAELWNDLLHKKTRKEQRVAKKIAKEREEGFIKYVLNGEPLPEKEELILSPEMDQIRKFCMNYDYYNSMYPSNAGIMDLVLRYLDHKICRICFMKRGRKVATVYHEETDTYSCPECGLESKLLDLFPLV
jgi:hypothetical protein